MALGDRTKLDLLSEIKRGNVTAVGLSQRYGQETGSDAVDILTREKLAVRDNPYGIFRLTPAGQKALQERQKQW